MTISRRGKMIPQWYKWVGLALLMLVGLTNYMDRLSISILQVPIKLDLDLSDTQLGAITGLSFSLVYTLAAVPIARLADRYSPKLIIVVSLAVWNVMTILCGAATGFLALAMLRMGVAIGEAGCAPATQALLANYFPSHQRGRAIAVWQMVFPLGSLLGIFFSGMLSAALGWRMTFVVLGGVGLAVVPIVMAFLIDPARPEVKDKAAATVAPGNLIGALRDVLEMRTFRLLLIAGFLGAIPLNAVLNWNAPFYGRAFSLPIQDVTYFVALISGVGGALGMIGGGFVSDALGRRDSRWYCWLPAIALIVAPFLIIYQYYGATTATGSLPAGIVGAILLNCWIPPQAAIAQSLVRPQNRALAAACILVTAGLGAAVGPFLAGVISDMIAARLGGQGEPLAYTLPILSLTAFPAAILFLRAGVRLRKDLAKSRDGIFETGAIAPA